MAADVGRGRLWRWLLTVSLVLAGLVGHLGQPAPVRAMEHAIGCTDGVGDTEALIAALAAANAGDTIVLAPDCTYTLDDVLANSTGLPTVNVTLTIEGNGATIARNSAADTPPFRLLRVAAGGDLTLNRVTLSNGAVTGSLSGGAISVESGRLTLTNSTLRDNIAGYAGGGIYNSGGQVTVEHSTMIENQAMYGGGIQNYFLGTLTVTNSTFSENVATTSGGALENAFGGSVTITNSTLSGNRAGSKGGGISNLAGKMTVIHSTLSENVADDEGSSIYNPGSANDVTLSRSILARSESSAAAECRVDFDTVTDGGYNLATDDTCRLTAPGSVQSVAHADLALGPLADNGGPTWTVALGVDSVAIDATPAEACADMSTDQRGIARPQGAGCDIGAVEALLATITLDPATSEPVLVEPRSRTARLTLRSTLTSPAGDLASALPLTYTLTPLDGGAPLTCVDASGTGLSLDGLGSACTLPAVPANRYSLTVTAGGNYVGEARGTVVVIDPRAGVALGLGRVAGGTLLFSGAYAGAELQGTLLYVRGASSDRLLLTATRLESLVLVGETVSLEAEARLNGKSGYRVLVTAEGGVGPHGRGQVQLQVWDPQGQLVAPASFEPAPLHPGRLLLLRRR